MKYIVVGNYVYNSQKRKQKVLYIYIILLGPVGHKPQDPPR